MSARLFGRAAAGDLPVAVRGRGVEIVDADGRTYLDAAGGAVVVSIGHGVATVGEAIARQAAQVAYVHGTTFGTAALSGYADALAPLLPLADPRIYPVSGGSEAVETALKMARAYHLARGEDRHLVIGRRGAYHGNTRGALDVSGRDGLRAPYLPWLGSAAHTGTPYEYRCPFPDTHPDGCGQRHAQALDELITRLGPQRVAAFIAEPVSGAALGACVPPPDYWPAVAEVCRRHGVLVIADEVMTGFGRTGRWFACEHWQLRPDLLVAAKGAASGYWPLGLAVCSGQVYDTIGPGGLTHGFTYSHHAVGAAAAHAVLDELVAGDLVARAAELGPVLGAALADRLGEHPAVGDIRGLGLLWGVELVADRDSRRPFPAADGVTRRVVTAARAQGLLLYSSTGCADGRDGDLLLFGPPLVITPEQIHTVADRTAGAIRTVLG